MHHAPLPKASMDAALPNCTVSCFLHNQSKSFASHVQADLYARPMLFLLCHRAPRLHNCLQAVVCQDSFSNSNSSQMRFQLDHSILRLQGNSLCSHQLLSGLRSLNSQLAPTLSNNQTIKRVQTLPVEKIAITQYGWIRSQCHLLKFRRMFGIGL